MVARIAGDVPVVSVVPVTRANVGRNPLVNERPPVTASPEKAGRFDVPVATKVLDTTSEGTRAAVPSPV